MRDERLSDASQQPGAGASEAAINGTVTPFPGAGRERRPAARAERAASERFRLAEPQHNLHLQLTSFVGREEALTEVGRLLATTRLLTLAGAPGVGKTRLALELAGAVLDAYADGVWLVELAPLAHPGLVPQAVAATLRVREQPGRPLAATLAEALRPRNLLLVLDNCEHLVAACAVLADGLLRACPKLRILATSREALGIAGETTFQVPALTLPQVEPMLERSGRPVEGLLASEAGRLFTARAQAALPMFRVTEGNAAALAHVCRRLDGIPLALELAAARVSALTPAQLAQRLDDCFRLLAGGRRTSLPRQQTLRATVDWSHDLLSEPERWLLRRLAVFAGGWTLEAAEGVCAGDGLAAGEILPLLVQLVDKSLVQAEEQDVAVRYRLLETLRQYGAEKLGAAGEEATLRDRHLAWFAALAERAESELWGADQVACSDRLRTELDNLRAALEWGQAAATRGEPEGAQAVDAALRLGGALWHFLGLRGQPSEVRGRLMELLALPLGGRAARAKALHAAAYLAYLQGDLAAARPLAREALALGRNVLDPFTLASALLGLSLAARIEGDLASASDFAEQGLALAREAGDRRGTYYSLYGLAEVARRQQDYARAAALMEEVLVLTREQGDRWSVGFALCVLGNVVWLQGDDRRATALQQESLALRREIGDLPGVAQCLDGLAYVARAQGQPARAARLFGTVDALRESIGVAPQPAVSADRDQAVAATRASLGEEAYVAAWAEGHNLPLDEAIAYALVEDAAAPATAPAPAALRGPVEPSGASVLSRREREVAALIARGLTNREIADELVISERTVDTHVAHILTKLDVRSRAQVAVWAMGRGLLEQAPP